AETRTALVGPLTAEQQPQQCRLSCPVWTGDTDTLAGVDLQRHGAQDEITLPHNDIVECRNDGARPRRGSDGEFECPLLTGFDDFLEACDPALHLTHLLRLLLAGLGGRASSVLVVVGRLAHRIADALTRPFPLRACACHEIGLLLGELVVLFAL